MALDNVINLLIPEQVVYNPELVSDGLWIPMCNSLHLLISLKLCNGFTKTYCKKRPGLYTVTPVQFNPAII